MNDSGAEDDDGSKDSSIQINYDENRPSRRGRVDLEEQGPSTSNQAEASLTTPLLSSVRSQRLRNSKFAQILGFALGSTSLGDSSVESSFRVMGRRAGDRSVPVRTSRRFSTITSPTYQVPVEKSSYENESSESYKSETNSTASPTNIIDQWAMNYQEAAIYLEEGFNNEQFSTHPKAKESLPAYMLAHTKWIYFLDLLSSLVLISLAIFEPPSTHETQMPVVTHASIEISALGIIAICLLLKLRWLGFNSLFTRYHYRTLLKGVLLLIMFSEAILVLGRQAVHFRVTRALRPIFLMDNRYCRDVRRFSREVLQSLPPILDMFMMLFFFISIFTFLGHFLFGKDPDDPYFNTIETSFVSLFVLLTTANFPDVMMPSYHKSRWAVLFFVVYLSTVLYFLMNLLLAVTYDTFTSLEREKFRKLVVHKRQACHFAFNLLVSKSNPNSITFRHFYGMMRVYNSKKSLRDCYLTFKALDRSNDGVLTREEFSKFYEFCDMSWKPLVSKYSNPSWSVVSWIGKSVEKLLSYHYIEHFFTGIVVSNVIMMVARWLYGGTSYPGWDAYLFASLFTVEITLKLSSWGPKAIITSGWNTFDLIATLAFVISLVITSFINSWAQLLTFVRPLRLIRIFKLKKRYRDVFGTLFILAPSMFSVAIVILLLYYFFAIIGMEVFANVQLKNCCNGTYLEPYYLDDDNGTELGLHFYMNTFTDLYTSYVTLFELMVVNNWYITMEGHTMVTSKWSRLYFISFYMVMMVVLTIIVAFILDTFLFRIQYKRSMDKDTEEKMLQKELFLTAEELDFCYRQTLESRNSRNQLLESYGKDLCTKDAVHYIGYKKRTKEILYKRMFRYEIPEWLHENEPAMGFSY